MVYGDHYHDNIYTRALRSRRGVLQRCNVKTFVVLARFVFYKRSEDD